MLWGNQEGGLEDGDSAVSDLEKQAIWGLPANITGRALRPWGGNRSGRLQEPRGGHCDWSRVRGRQRKVSWRGDSPWMLCCCFCNQSPVPEPSPVPPWPPSQYFTNTGRGEFSSLKRRAGLGTIMPLEAPSLLLTFLYPFGSWKANSRRHPSPSSLTGNFLPILCVSLSQQPEQAAQLGSSVCLCFC